MTQAGTSAAGRLAAADVLLALWRCCWSGGCAAGPADVVRAHGGQDELECAASPVDVLLALRGRATLQPQSDYQPLARARGEFEASANRRQSP